jgi:hypothetical protein
VQCRVPSLKMMDLDDGPHTQEELDQEAQKWGFKTWEEFSDAIDDALDKHEMEQEGFVLYSTGVYGVSSR